MRYKNKVIQTVVLIIIPIAVFGFWRDLPDGISYESPYYQVGNGDVKFIRDLTYLQDSTPVYDQEIFDNVYALIDSAEQFLVLDFFLFLETSNDTNSQFIPTTSQLTDKLIEKKEKDPQLPIYFITDEFNIFYYSHKNSHLERMKKAGINVIISDMLDLPDSHQPYSFIWRIFPRWFGDPNYKGWLPNPFTEPDKKIAFRSLLKLLNFKANHRKVALSEKAGIITSANPHTASSLHSNIGFIVKGQILGDLLYSEKAVAELSDRKIDIDFIPPKTTGPIGIKYITEMKIRKYLLKNIKTLNENDSLDICVFYFSDRKIIKAIKNANQRNVSIRLLLDANKDAFGKKKNGLPNRQIAWELHKKGIPVRWANTHGEQFHTKIAIFSTLDSVVVIGGSANFTDRNIGDKNLEADLLIKAARSEPIAREIKRYYRKIWNNNKFSLSFEVYKDTSFLKYWLYRYQEFSGACTY